jgi:hypothetical protein
MKVTRRFGPSVFTLVSCSAYSVTLKIEAVYSSETSVDCQQTTRRYIPEDSRLYNLRCENLKSCKYENTFLMLVACLSYSPATKMEVVCSSKTSANTSTWHHKPEDTHLTHLPSFKLLCFLYRFILTYYTN